MSLAQKNNHVTDWMPSATMAILKQRADLLKKIRLFFAARDVLEVETPLLCRTSVTDPYINSIVAQINCDNYYLQTSPEYAMKRLLAAGSGSIYQICKAFRQEEKGRYHNPEFTLLEWYRIDFDHHQLMNEVDELLQDVLGSVPADYMSYQDCFLTYLNINPHQENTSNLISLGADHHITIDKLLTRDDWLQILFSTCIEPKLGKDKPCFIYDFPASQAALANIPSDHPHIASRFELYWKGIELANGFHELQDMNEQKKRFQQNGHVREKLGLPCMKMDEKLLAALSYGLPNCAGVALGLDRLMMIAAHQSHIKEVLSFDIERI